MQLPLAAGIGVHQQKLFSRHIDHAVTAKDLGPLEMIGHQVAEQQGTWAALELEDAEGTIFNTRRTLVHVGFALNVAHYPGTFVVTEQVTVHIGLM